MSTDGSARSLIDLLTARLATGTSPTFVALDGRSGVGKSTMAAQVADFLGPDEDGHPITTVIEGDSFYAGGSSATWDRRTVLEKVAGVIDWRAQRTALESLRSTGAAAWRGFDWSSDDWDREPVPHRADRTTCRITPVVILEGAYSARPELADMFDLRVLLTLPTELRRDRLLRREGEAYRTDWEQRWSNAEDLYFTTAVPRGHFDLLIGTPT